MLVHFATIQTVTYRDCGVCSGRRTVGKKLSRVTIHLLKSFSAPDEAIEK
jgi:hypothetical protein